MVLKHADATPNKQQSKITDATSIIIREGGQNSQSAIKYELCRGARQNPAHNNSTITKQQAKQTLTQNNERKTTKHAHRNTKNTRKTNTTHTKQNEQRTKKHNQTQRAQQNKQTSQPGCCSGQGGGQRARHNSH